MPQTASPTQLVLASTSPFRKALLERLGLPFVIANPATDETAHLDEAPEPLVRRLAEAKARAVAPAHPAALIIGSDQVACLDGQILGKPGTRERACAQLQAAAGRTLRFYTGLCLFNSQDGSSQVDCVPFDVTFRALSQAEIHGYLDKEKPFNCAGSFKAEGLGIALFERLDGTDPNALIGLPLIRLTAMLRQAGWCVLT